MEIYIVQPGDSVFRIAREQNVSEESIIYSNQLEYPYPLVIGQALLLPKGTPNSERRLVETGGYAYPYIDRTVLTQTLPYLSKLFVFSYGFTAEGELLPPRVDDSFMIEAARSYGVAPILTLTPLGPDGNFSNYLISQIVNSEQKKSRLIADLIEMVQQKAFQGVDIDFEYILPEDRLAFVQFVVDVRNAVNAIGYPVSVALAPKTSDNQKGTLYEGKDYRLLGEAADEVLLMTYEWGYTYGPPMAVAPVDEVRRVVEYAVTRISPEKINLGIPNYGYDWTLPFVQGESKARVVGNVQAVQIAASNGAEILYDERAKSPYFTYYKDGVAHEVWFEDVRSMEAKFTLVQEYGLKGMGYWQIMRLFLANWLLLADIFRIRRV